MEPMPRSATAGAPSPRRAGATYATTWSTSPACQNAAASVAPPSSQTCRLPSVPQPPQRLVRAPGVQHGRAGAVQDAAGPQPAQAHHGPPRLARPVVRRAGRGRSAAGRRSRRCRCPTRMVSASARRSCTSWRADGPVIHWLVPSAAAPRPSSVEASFQVTTGRPRSLGLLPAGHQRVGVARAAPASRSGSTSIPRPRSRSAPPAASGCGVRPGEDDAGHAGRDQGGGARTGAPGVPAGLQGDDGGAAVRGRAGPRRARRPRRAGCRHPRASPRRRPGRRRPGRRSRPAGWGRSAGPCGASISSTGHGRVDRRPVDASALHVRAGHLDPSRLAVRAGSGVDDEGGPSSSRRSAPARPGPARRRRHRRKAPATPRVSSHPDSHRRSWSSTRSTGRWLRSGRGLSPPARNFTDPGARVCCAESSPIAAVRAEDQWL